MQNALSVQQDVCWYLKRTGAYLLLCFAVLLSCNFPAYAVDKVTLQLRWDHQFQFAGYYCAQWQGYYAEEGLEVSIRPGVTQEGIINATEEVIAGRADFGIGGADILKANENKPLAVLATIMQHSGAGFFALPGTDLRTPADFAWLRVARNVDDLIDLELQALLKSEGIDPSTVVPYPHQAGLDHLLKGGVDVIPGLAFSLPYTAALKGQQLIFLSLSDFGINFYGDSLFTTHEFLQNNENLVKRFRRASLKGWQYALGHRQEIAARIAKELERTATLPDALTFNIHQSEKLVDLMDYPIIDVGHINPARWQQMHAYLKDLGILDKEIDLGAFIYDPKQYELRRAEKWQTLFSLVSFSLGSAYSSLFSGMWR